jgi:hypothetical protein
VKEGYVQGRMGNKDDGSDERKIKIWLARRIFTNYIYKKYLKCKQLLIFFTKVPKNILTILKGAIELCFQQ